MKKRVEIPLRSCLRSLPATVTGALPGGERQLTTMISGVAESLGASACLVHLVDTESGRLAFAAGTGETTGSPFRRGVLAPTPLMKQVLAGKAVHLRDVRRSPDRWCRILRCGGWLSLLGAPIRFGDQVIGVIWALGHKTGAFMVDDASLLALVGRQVGGAVGGALVRPTPASEEVRRGDMARVVRRVVERHRAAARDSGLLIDLAVVGDGGYTVAAPDPVADRIVDNLLADAIRFTAAGGRIEVRLTALVGGVSLEVQDKGVGIPAAVNPRVDRGLRRALVSLEPESAEDGLAVASRLVTALGGIMNIARDEGQGSRLTLRLAAA